VTEPRPKTWKVLVLGNSVATMVVPPRTSRDDMTYGEALESLLRSHGWDAEVRNAGRWYELLAGGVRRFMEEERTLFPDVVIIQYGINECQPAVMPMWLIRHFVTWDRGQGALARWYRDAVAPHFWVRLRNYQRRMSAIVGLSTWRMRAGRFARELTRLVQWMREDKCLVLVLDVNRPGSRLTYFMPGLEARWEVYQRVLAETVAQLDDSEVRLVPVSKVVEEFGQEAGLPDGLHYTAAAHRRVAELLADEIESWITAEG